jgi:hypothetical protein
MKKEKILKKKKKNVKKDENKNIKLKKINDKKIILETSSDLYKLPYNVIKKTKLYDYSGKYFEQMFKELLKAEKNGDELQISNIYNKTSINKQEIIISKIIIRIINPFYKSQQELGIIGSIKELGNWNQEKSLKMEYNEEENIWQKEFELNNKEDFEYKFIFISNGIIKKWEDGNNRIFKYSYIIKLIEMNLEDGIAHLEEENQESFEYYLNEQLLIINCDWLINK